jgi:ABC-type proline/glycine betaine transport system substrate-binding protein
MMHFLLLEYREKVLNNSRMQFINKGGYFGAANKFQKANIHTSIQATTQANNPNVLCQCI